MPMLAPWYRPEPKSAWTGRSAPIEAISVAEFLATGRRSTRRFHALSRGKTGQRGAPRSGRPAVVAATASSASRAAAATAVLIEPRLRPTGPGGTLAAPHG